ADLAGGRELLVEIIAGKNGPLTDDTIATALEELYSLGIKPDWWKLEPQASLEAWKNIDAVIAKNDPWRLEPQEHDTAAPW
ncbi:2-deoxy-5-keto-D-gluconate 6-phosphate aldolase domain-containing protein, partial [Rhizobium ruizarguesonis]